MMSTLKILMLLLLALLQVTSSQEPSCYTTNRFEYEFNVLHKLDSLEQSRTEMTEQMSSLQSRLRGKFCVLFEKIRLYMHV